MVACLKNATTARLITKWRVSKASASNPQRMVELHGIDDDPVGLGSGGGCVLFSGALSLSFLLVLVLVLIPDLILIKNVGLCVSGFKKLQSFISD